MVGLTLRRRDHVILFVAHNGPGPYPCTFCDEPVPLTVGRHGKGTLAVHHLDHDDENNDPLNLAAAHFECHSRHHTQGGWMPPDKREPAQAKAESTYRQRYATDPALRERAAANHQAMRRPEHAEKIRAGMARRKA